MSQTNNLDLIPIRYHYNRPELRVAQKGGVVLTLFDDHVRTYAMKISTLRRRFIKMRFFWLDPPGVCNDDYKSMLFRRLSYQTINESRVVGC